MELKTLIVGPLDVNCYFVGHPDEIIIIDPGDDAGRLMEQLKSFKYSPCCMINTHGHIDHLGAVKHLQNHYSIPFYIHKEEKIVLQQFPVFKEMIQLDYEAPSVVKFIDENFDLTSGPYFFEIIHTPGHSPGSICIKCEDYLFSGDTLFSGSIGRTDLPGGSFDQIKATLNTKILPLSDSMKIFPGHGPSTTLAAERRSNPFLQDNG